MLRMHEDHSPSPLFRPVSYFMTGCTLFYLSPSLSTFHDRHLRCAPVRRTLSYNIDSSVRGHCEYGFHMSATEAPPRREHLMSENDRGRKTRSMDFLQRTYVGLGACTLQQRGTASSEQPPNLRPSCQKRVRQTECVCERVPILGSYCGSRKFFPLPSRCSLHPSWHFCSYIGRLFTNCTTRLGHSQLSPPSP
jgi:hypothetical protein